MWLCSNRAMQFGPSSAGSAWARWRPGRELRRGPSAAVITARHRLDRALSGAVPCLHERHVAADAEPEHDELRQRPGDEFTEHRGHATIVPRRATRCKPGMQKPKRICTRAGCRGIVVGNVCSICGPRAAPHDRRGSASSRGYDRAWQRRREQFLAGHPLCEVCKLRGLIRAATIAHHVDAVSEGHAVLAEDEDLVAVCSQACHNLIESVGHRCAKCFGGGERIVLLRGRGGRFQCLRPR